MFLYTLKEPFEYQPLGQNLEEKLLDACSYQNVLHIGKVILDAMHENPKLTLSGFELFLRTQEANSASRIFLLAAPMSFAAKEVTAVDFRDNAVVKSYYLHICVNGPLAMMQYMEDFGLEDHLHNLRLLDTETGVLVRE